MFRRLLRRSFWLRFGLCLALLVAAFFGRRWWRHHTRHPWVAPLAARAIFADEFDGVAPNPLTKGRLDPLKWQVQGPDQILQRTQWGGAPDLQRDADGTTYARLSLETHNPRPEKAGRFHQSTQITSLDRWNLENGLEYEARLRADHLPPGLILGFFAYGDAGVWRDTYQKTEADFELLTHQGGQQVWTHLWDNWNPLRQGSNEGRMWGTVGANWNDGSWNTFKIRWYPGRTEWILNDHLIRREGKVRPGSPMGVWFNLWAPNPDWLDAYNPAIQAAKSPAQSQKYSYDIDYVRVRRIPPESQNSGAERGRGEGLRGTYFSTQNFQGQKVVRLDPRLDFDWGRYAPASTIGFDGFSVRWEGTIQARFSETYTFSLASDDGARLWIDNKPVVDAWRVQAMRTHQGQIAMRAGARVPIRVEMFNQKGRAGIQLGWQSASTPPEIVPQSQLYVPTRPAAPQFSHSGGTLSRAQEITIQTPTRGAAIHYTLGGNPPTRSSRKLLKSGKLRISYTSLVRAAAFVEGEVPSETARAFYVLPDQTPPQVAFTSPPPDFQSGAIPPVEGLVSDGGSGVTRLDLVIIRASDGYRWKEGRWSKEEWGIGARIRDSRWSVRDGFPPQSALQPGKYELKAVAYDLAGNIKGTSQTLVIAARPKEK